MRLSLQRRPRLCESLHDLTLYLDLCITDKSCKNGFLLRMSSKASGRLVHRQPSLPPPNLLPSPELEILSPGWSEQRKALAKKISMTDYVSGVKSNHKLTIYHILAQLRPEKKTEESVQPEFEENQKSPEFRRCCRRHPIEKHAWVIVKNLAHAHQVQLTAFLSSCMRNWAW